MFPGWTNVTIIMLFMESIPFVVKQFQKPARPSLIKVLTTSWQDDWVKFNHGR